MPETKPIDKIQVKLIHIALNKLGLSDEAYRLILNQRYWVNSCLALSYDEATNLIKHFQEMGFKIITKRFRTSRNDKTAPNIIQLVSPQQLKLIEHLRADIRWHVQDGYFRWLKKWLKKDRITTGKEAFRVIEGLKGMLARQQRARITDTGTDNGLHRDGGMHGGKWQW
jgi:hypothetical protein